MMRFGFVVGFALLLSIGAPLSAYAANNLPILNPAFEIVPDPSEHSNACQRGDPLSYGAVLQMMQNLMNAGISVGILILIIVIIYAGALFLFSPVNPGNREMGRTMLMNAVIGFVIVIAAWLIVDFVMKALYDSSASVGGDAQLGPWNEIIGTGGDWCVQSMDTKPLYGGAYLGDGADLSAVAGSGASGGAGGGKCEVPPNDDNPCSVANMQKSCFAGRAVDASRVCMFESANGNPAIPSGTDKLNSGAGPSYSIGLWQINLTTHRVGGLDCPSAFTMTCGRGNNSLIEGKLGHCRASIKPGKEALYEACVVAAKNPVNNTEVACRLYNQKGANGGFQPWYHTAAVECKVPLH